MKIKGVFSLLLVTLLPVIMVIISCFLLPCAAFTNEVGSEMMFDLWKYRTGEANTGLLTGKPSKPKSAKPPSITANVTGTIYCKQSIALLHDDVVEIQLLDVSRQDAPALVIAQQRITSVRQVSIPFKLTYDPATINPTHKYAVQARILRNGQVRFKITSVYGVITYGYPKRVDVLVEMTGTRSADENAWPQSVNRAAHFIGTYKRNSSGAGGTVEETLHIRSNETVELHSRYTKGVVQRTGVWSPEGKLLAVTLTTKNGAYINPERIVFELKGDRLMAVEYDRAAGGPDYSFTRTAIIEQRE